MGTRRRTWGTFSVFYSLSFFLSFFLLFVVVIPQIANLKIGVAGFSRPGFLLCLVLLGSFEYNVWFSFTSSRREEPVHKIGVLHKKQGESVGNELGKREGTGLLNLDNPNWEHVVGLGGPVPVFSLSLSFFLFFLLSCRRFL